MLKSFFRWLKICRGQLLSADEARKLDKPGKDPFEKMFHRVGRIALCERL
jgi:hypothetical protein